jgi:hypothetical protein
MKLHARTHMVNQAHSEAGLALLEIWKKYDLTWGEIVAFHAAEQQSAARYIIRTERHPDDPEKRGDEA